MKLPAAPILAVLERAAVAHGFITTGETAKGVHGLDGFVNTLGINRRLVWQARETGVITVALADRIAIALNLHPILIWPAEWPVEAPDDDEEADRQARAKAHYNAYQREWYQRQKTRGAA